MGEEKSDMNMAAQLHILNRHLTRFGVLLWDLRILKTRLKYQVHGACDEAASRDDGNKIPSDLSLASAAEILGNQVEALGSVIDDMSGHMGSFDEVSGVGAAVD